MFGALNRFISRLDSDSPSQSYGDSYGTFGFQVLRNKNQDIPIDPWYDFIVEINGRPVVCIHIIILLFLQSRSNSDLT